MLRYLLTRDAPCAKTLKPIGVVALTAEFFSAAMLDRDKPGLAHVACGAPPINLGEMAPWLSRLVSCEKAVPFLDARAERCSSRI